MHISIHKTVKKSGMKAGVLVALLTTFGCVDNNSFVERGAVQSTREQAVTVLPQFTITGSETVPDNLFLTELGLVVSEIRLEPIFGESGLAYTTRDPIAMKFDISHNQLSQTGDLVTLPEAGRYLVSIRLEPVATFDGETDPFSFRLKGFVAEESLLANPAKTSDGTPLPLPFDEKPLVDEENNEESAAVSAETLPWTPFAYNSKQTVFYTFSDVEFQPGEQRLEFSFDVRDWVIDVADPISKAIRNSADDEDGVDVTRQVDSAGRGVESLIENGVVHTDQL